MVAAIPPKASFVVVGNQLLSVYSDSLRDLTQVYRGEILGGRRKCKFVAAPAQLLIDCTVESVYCYNSYNPSHVVTFPMAHV